MTIASRLNEISKLSLLACDQAYLHDHGKQLVVRRGMPLAELSDTPAYDFRIPYTVPPGFVVDEVGEHGLTGFKFAAFRNASTNEVVIAMAGTDGGDRVDWAANLALGWSQWNNDGAGRELVNAYLNRIGEEGFTGRIHFTGQSLGGALAEYAAFEYFDGLRNVDSNVAERMTLTTFNGLGARDGLRLYGNRGSDEIARFDSAFATLAAAGSQQVAHYFVTNDLIHRLGGGHLGGPVYELKFVSERINPVTGSPYLLDPIDAHRIETGFYRPFALQGTDENPFFMAAVEKTDFRPLPSVRAQQFVGHIAAFMNDKGMSKVSAQYRILASVATGLMLLDQTELRDVMPEVLGMLRDSNAISNVTYEVIANNAVVFRELKAAAEANKVAAASALAAALVIDQPTLWSQEDFAAMLEMLPIELRPAMELVTQGFYEAKAAEQRVADVYQTFVFLHPELVSHAQVLQEVRVDPLEIARHVFQKPNALQATASYLLDLVTNRSADVPTAVPALMGLLASASEVAARRGEASVITELLGSPQAAAVFLAELPEKTKSTINDLSKAVANSFVDFARKHGSAFDLKRTFNRFSEWRGFSQSLEEQILSPGFSAEMLTALELAQDTVESAGQTVVVLPSRPANPFDDEEFDPDAAPSISLGGLKEGGVEVLTAFLPYAAPEGGQRIRFTLTGEGAEKFTAIDEEVELGPDGTFVFTVAEGQRELSFGLWAREDIDLDAVLTLSATLVDDAGQATHQTHDEATFAVDGEDESPAGGTALDLHGDWGLKLFPVFDVNGELVLDEFGNVVMEARADDRYPHRFNLARDQGGPRFPQDSHPLIGHEGPDHIWLGEFGAEWHAMGLGGDDHLEGLPNVPNLMEGDQALNFGGYTGNDTIEGGINLQPYDTGTFLKFGVEIAVKADDTIFGGLGDDRLFADSIGLVDETLDPSTPALDQKGDWINGEQGDDRIFGSAAHDALFGGGGADVIRAGAGNDVLDGDDSYYNSADSWWEIRSGPFVVEFFPVTNVSIPGYPLEYYRDFGGPDILDGGSGDDVIFGMLGDDTLLGADGEDVLQGWEGDDKLFGGDGADKLAGDFGRNELPVTRLALGYTVMPGVAGEVVHSSHIDQVGNDYLDGGAGDDILTGEAGDDILLGADGADVLLGDAEYLDLHLHGADLLDGGPGDDVLTGHGGDDRMHGGPGADTVEGNDGNDFADGGAGDDNVSGNQGDDILHGGAGADVIAGDSGFDELHGGKGDDALDGGADDDTLYAGDGADQLSGGDGNDSLYGGGDEDVLLGGPDDDFLDGGAGADVLRGGPGNDTYVFGPGYGSDAIDDEGGSSRIQLSGGVTPEELSASLDDATLMATVELGLAGDSVTFNMSELQLAGLDFESGESWTRQQLLQLVPALSTEGSDGGEALTANPFVRNDLQGFGGDDAITGSANSDRLEGGDGADALDGAAGSDVYAFAGGETGIDLLSDSTLEARAYLEWYYAVREIQDWAERGSYGGKYKAVVEGESESGFTRFYSSYEQAYAELPFATISFIEPLAELAPLVQRDDAKALDALVGAGIVSADIVEFGPGLALSDLILTITVNEMDADEHPEQPWFSGGTLAVRSGDAGFDVKVPGVNYGFVGSNLLADGTDPRFDAPGAWRGYRLGEGIEGFRFADGSTYSLEQVLEHAAVHAILDDYGFARGTGTQTISRRYGTVMFDPDIAPEELSVVREETDLLLTLSDGSAQGRIQGWYDDSDSTPSVTLEFASGEQVDTATLTERGLRVTGTDADEIILGLDSFNDVLSGGAGSDVLNAGAGKDTYVFMRGDGPDTITELPAGAADPDASIVLFPDYSSWEASFAIGSLVVDFQNGDAVHFSGFDADRPYETPVFDRLEFADGFSLSYEEILAGGFWLQGTDDDDLIAGTAVADRIFGAGGNDFLSGGEGDDSIEAGEGNDVLAGGPGSDYLSGDVGSDLYIYSAADDSENLFDWSEVADEVDTLRFVDVTSAEVRVTQDPWSYHLVLEDGSRLLIDSMVQEQAAVLERVEFADGITWSPADLAAAVQLLPSTPGDDDPLWGTPEADLIDGQEGADLLYGNQGDDILIGGEGQDLYFFAPGDGHDFIHNSDADGLPDSVVFAGIASTDVQLAKSGTDLVLRSGEDSVSLGGWYGEANGSSYLISFEADGAYWDDAVLLELAPTGGNSSPEPGTPIGDQAATEDTPFSFALPAESFFDADGATLTYSAGSLPDWLSFDLESLTLAGLPAQADVGSAEVEITATDPEGLSASGTFVVTVLNANDAPTVANPLAEYSFEAGAPFSLILPADTFVDEDPDDVAILGAALFDGGVLPAWLSFDPETRSFLGNPGKKINGISHVVITATDLEGASVAADFGLVIRARAGSSVTGTKDDDLIYGGTGDETLTAKGGNDALFGGEGDDLLKGGTGGDVLQGGEGDDTLRGGTGQNLLDGGAGDDLIYGGKESSLIVGGAGNDTIRTGHGNDVVLFNRGDGSDTVIADRVGDNTLSFGGGIRYSDLTLSRSGKDLVVNAGDDDRVVLKDWYNGKKSILSLQIIADASDDFDATSPDPLRNRSVQTFDFGGMVGAFDQARKVTPGLTSWAFTNALLQFHLSGADDLALGGDLSYWYAKNRGLGGISLTAAQQVIGAAGFGSEAQNLRPFGGLQEGFVKLAL